MSCCQEFLNPLNNPIYENVLFTRIFKKLSHIRNGSLFYWNVVGKLLFWDWLLLVILVPSLIIKAVVLILKSHKHTQTEKSKIYYFILPFHLLKNSLWVQDPGQNKVNYVFRIVSALIEEHLKSRQVDIAYNS